MTLLTELGVGLADLATIPFAETLSRLSAERRSGDLQVRSGRVAKTVFFDHGRVVFAASNLKKDRLGEALVTLGRITGEEFHRASALMLGKRSSRFGEALVRAGILDKNEVGRSVARQVKRIVLSLFELDEGVASFEERRCAIPLDYMVSLSVHRLLYEGVKAMKSRELILAGLGDLDQRVTLAPVPPFNFDPRTSPAIERDIMEHGRRRVTLRRLAWGYEGLDFERLRAVYALLSSGVLQPSDGGRSPSPMPIIQTETGTFLLSALRRRPDLSPPEALRQEVKAELERSARLDRETWLEVSASAPREEVIKALEEKMERYHVLLDAVWEDEELRTDVEVILGRASAMLRVTRQSAATRAARPAPRPRTPRSRHAQRLLREGDAQMTVSDYASAVKTYEQLVKLDPDDATVRARLAVAMASHPPTAQKAEREFLEALRLEPDSADIHYRLGLYYNAMKQRGRALVEMQTAVRLDSTHEPARQALKVLSPRDSALTRLKRRR